MRRLLTAAAQRLLIVVAQMLGICSIPNDEDIPVGMPLWTARAGALCDHITNTKKNTKETWYPIFLRYLVR